MSSELLTARQQKDGDNQRHLLFVERETRKGKQFSDNLIIPMLGMDRISARDRNMPCISTGKLSQPVHTTTISLGGGIYVCALLGVDAHTLGIYCRSNQSYYIVQ